MRRFLLLTLLTPVLLTGCGGAPAVPPDNYYRIEVPPPAVERIALLPGTVLVHPLTGSGLLQERPVLFTTAGQLHQMRQHDYHYWNEAPPRMLQSALITYLRAGHIADTIVTPDLRVPADYEIIGRVKRLEQVLAEPSRVLVELELAVVDTAATQLVTSRSYLAEAKSNGTSVKAAVVALNQALSKAFAEFVADVRNAGPQIQEADPLASL